MTTSRIRNTLYIIYHPAAGSRDRHFQNIEGAVCTIHEHPSRVARILNDVRGEGFLHNRAPNPPPGRALRETAYMYKVDPHLITGQIHRGFHLWVIGYKIFQYMSVPLKTERLSDLTELEWWTEAQGSVEEVMSHSAQC